MSIDEAVEILEHYLISTLDNFELKEAIRSVLNEINK